MRKSRNIKHICKGDYTKERKTKQPDEPKELKRVITFTVNGMNRAEKLAILQAFCTKFKTKSFVGIQKGGARLKFPNYMNKEVRQFLESAGIKIVIHTKYSPTGKDHIGKLSVSIVNDGASYMDGVKAAVVVLAKDEEELTENIHKIELLFLAHLRRYNIPATRMCITDGTMCIVKYTDDKTKLAELDYFDGQEPDYDSDEEEEDFEI